MTTNEVESKREEGAQQGAPMTAGQRLAAQKAAKAASKAAKRGRDGEVRETEALKRAALASDWLSTHRSKVIGAVATVAIVAVVAVSFLVYRDSRAAASSQRLGEAARVANAPVIAEGESAGTDVEESYGSIEARAEAALERYRKAAAEGIGEGLAWAKLGEGTALLQLGKANEARAAFEAARAASDEPFVAATALEGEGFAHEAEQAWEKALSRYAELAKIDGGTYKELAQLHQARVALAQGDEAKGKETLQALRTRLREENAPRLPFVKRQADAMLRQLDATLAQEEGGAGGSFSQEQLEELLRRLQSQEAPSPAGGAGE